MSSPLDSKNMEESQFKSQLQERIDRWLKSGKKSGFTDSDSETVVLSSILGKRSENQDRTIFLRAKFDEPSKPSIAALVLCDGMGGMVSGGDCANLAISTFAESLVLNKAVTLTEKLKVAVNSANQAVYEDFHGRGGATLSAVVCNDVGEWVAVNVGDSRIYRVLHSGVVEQLTVDDTLEKQLADLDLPSPPPEFRQLLQYIGMGEGIVPRHIELEISSDIKWFLITSDGAHDISEDVFQSLILYAESPEEVVHRLTNFSEWLGGKDNSTVAVLTFGINLFERSRESAFNSLEIWSIPGKAEFFGSKSFRTDAPVNRTLSVAEVDFSGTAKNHQQGNTSQQKKPSRKKNHENVHKADLNGANGSKIDNNGTAHFEKTVPQLNIEFSEEN
jgi:PPM family protein phosphatase